MADGKEYWRYISQIRAEETIGLVATRSKTEVPLKSVTCHVTIQGFVAEIEAILHYESEAKDVTDTVFVFPLETGSTVYSFTARINERLLIGECQSKYAALKRYTEALEEGAPVSMLIQEDNESTFRCGVGPIPPLTPVIIRLSYVQELNVGVDKGIHYTLPGLMNPAQRPVIGGFQRQWSLMSHTSLTRSTLNRSSLRPGFLATPTPRHIPLALDFELEVKGQYKVMAIKTPRDQLSGSFLNQEDTHVKGTLAEPFKFDHDLVLGVYYENIDLPSVIVEPGDLNQDGLLGGTVVMINLAPDISEEGPMLGETKDFVLMLDCTSEKHFDRIKESVSYFLRSIPVGARFNICTYSETFKFLFPQGSQLYNESTFKQALTFQRTIELAAGSYPSLHGPMCHLYRRYELPTGGERQIIVVSTGTERFSSVICKLVHDNTHNTRVHTIGICPDHTPSIVSDLAVAGKGTAQYIHQEACSVSSKLLRCLRCALQPCVRDLNLEWTLPEGVSVNIIPNQLPTLLCGERCIIYAVLHGAVDPHAMNLVRVSGINHSLYFSHEVVFCVPETDINFSESMEEHFPIHRMMAKSWMEESLNKCYNDVPGTLAGSEANIVSPFTTFLLVDKSGGPQPVPFLDHQSLPNGHLPPNLRAKAKDKGTVLPLKKWLALAGGAIFRRKSKRKALPASELTQMITLQQWSGSWELDKGLAELLCLPLKIIKKENPYRVVPEEEASWATALAMVWMEGYHEEKVSEWDLIADKATHYLKNRLTDSNELMRRAALLLGMQIEELTDTYW